MSYEGNYDDGDGGDGEEVFPEQAFPDGSGYHQNEQLFEEPTDAVMASDEEPKKKKRKKTKEEKEEKKRKKREKKEKRRREKEKRQKEVSQKRKRHKKGASADTDHPTADEGNIPSEEDEKKPKKKRKAEMTEAEASDTVHTMIDQMNQAADEDDASVAQGKPALSKLAILDTICSEISKPKWVHWFIREGVCQALARWLAPLSNGRSPNITIRTRVLQLVQKMPLFVEHLQGTSLGVRLITMWKAPDELEDNRAIIREIVHSLLRPVFGVKWSQRASDLADLEETSIPRTAPTKEIAASYDASSSRRARIPQQVGYSFKLMPKSNFKGFQQETSRDSESTMARLNRKMAYRKTFGNRQANRAQNVSVSKSAN